MAYMRGKYYTYENFNGSFWMFGLGFVPPDIVDDFVVMRYAKLVEEGKIKKTEKRAIRNCEGNIGCDALRKKYGKETIIEQAERITKRKK